MDNTLTTLIRRQLERYPSERPALWQRDRDGRWLPISWQELARMASSAACAMEILGLREQERIAVFSPNDPRILATDFGCFANRAVTVSIYATSSQEQVEYILRDSGAAILFAGTASQYEIARKVISRVATLRQIVV